MSQESHMLGTCSLFMLKTKVPILAEFRVPEARVFLVKPSSGII